MTYTKYWIPFPFVDIYFIVWQPNTVSKIHNHSKNGCHMFILKGMIREEIYTKNLSLTDINYYSTFDKSYIDDNIGYHRIKNSDQYSYSLHIYRPKNHVTIYYD
jgi:hypothetical protein